MTAHSITKKAAAHCGIAFESAYAAHAAVAREHGFLVGAGRHSYRMTGQPLAEAVLAMFVAGAGLAPDLPAFLSAIRLNGAAANLGKLLDLADAGEPSHLAESWVALDRHGNCRWTYVEARDGNSVALGWCDFGAKPGTRTVSIDGAALAEVLA
ncbi:hypothetical protein [Albidovulum sp.]|uniref:hypothetical protein n=1 Tax=Albidovulum sp. TaxID=1872424 RepID=UPI0039B9C22B